MKKITSILTAITMISGMAFAVSAEESTFALGDVDMDGIITGRDAAIVSQYADGILKLDLNEEQFGLADMNGDGAVDAADAALISAIQEYELGDVNLDGRADIPDGTYALHMLFLKEIDSEIDFDKDAIRADIDCNGVLDEYDAYGLLHYYALGATEESQFEEGKFYFVVTPEIEQRMIEKAKNMYIKPMTDANPDLHIFDDYNIENVKTLNEIYVVQLKKSLDKYLDVDGDEAVTISDATTVLQMYAENAAETGIYKASADENEKADVNLDGKVDIDDAMLILKAYAMNAAGLL